MHSITAFAPWRQSLMHSRFTLHAESLLPHSHALARSTAGIYHEILQELFWITKKLAPPSGWFERMAVDPDLPIN